MRDIYYWLQCQPLAKESQRMWLKDAIADARDELEELVHDMACVLIGAQVILEGIEEDEINSRADDNPPNDIGRVLARLDAARTILRRVEQISPTTIEQQKRWETGRREGVFGPRFRCETCQNEATVHIDAVGFHFCASCLEKIDARLRQP